MYQPVSTSTQYHPLTLSVGSVLLCASDEELRTVDTALRRLDSGYATDPILLHCGHRLSACPNVLAKYVERAITRSGCGWFDDMQCNLAATVLAEGGISVPPEADILELDELLRSRSARMKGDNALRDLALALATIRRVRLARATRLSLRINAARHIRRRAPQIEAESTVMQDVLTGAWDNLKHFLPLDLLDKKAAEEMARIGKVNILICGQTGAGKSTLINAVFGEHVAPTGFGRPITKDITWYEPPMLPARLCDTRGLETADFPRTLAALEIEIAERAKRNDANEHVHVLWLCIPGYSTRVQESESNILALCTKYRIPGIVVLTQCNDRRSIKLLEEARKELPEARAFVRLLAETYDDSDPPKEPFGLADLVERTLAEIPEGVRNAFDAAQKVVMERKRRSAYAAALEGAAATAAAAALPVPGVSEGAVIGAIITSVVRIATIMGVPMTRDNLVPLSTSMVGALLTTLLVRLAAGEALKLVPGIGSLGGALINAGIAAPATYGFSSAFIEYLTMFHASHNRMPEGTEIKDGFRAFWKQWGDKERALPDKPEDA